MELKNINSLADCFKLSKEPKFSVGDQVKLCLNDLQYSKHGNGKKSMRKNILEELCHQWQMVKLTNDPYYSKKNSRKIEGKYLNKKRYCLGKLWDEKKGWIRTIMNVLDNDHKAFIYAIEPISSLGLSSVCPANTCYLDGRYSSVRLIKYHVLIVGERGVCFKLLLSDYQFKINSEIPKEK